MNNSSVDYNGIPHHQHKVKGLRSCQKTVSVCTVMAEIAVVKFWCNQVNKT